MKNKNSKRVKIKFFIAAIIFFIMISAQKVQALTPFIQEAQYQGGYDVNAVQPTVYNWTKQSRFMGPELPEKKWSFATGNSLWGSSTIGADGTIYIGCGDGKLYAVNPDGTKKWSWSIVDPITSSAPVIGADGTIYVGSNGYNKLYAINPDGTQKWCFAVGSYINSSPAIAADGTIYIGADDKKLHAINPDGTEKWSYTVGDAIQASAAIAADGTVYVGSYDGQLYAINPDGTKKWSFSTAPFGIGSCPAIGSDGTIYIGSIDKKIHALNPSDGTQKWSFTTGSSVLSSPAVGADGTIYAGSLDKNIYALNPDGSKKWSFAAESMIFSTPLIGANGIVYVASNQGRIYAINPNDGTQKWVYDMGTSTNSTPALGADETIYIGANDYKLYAIGSISVTSAASIGDITVVNGTDISAINLPANVNITLSDNTTISAAVTWDNNSTPTYNSSAAATYTFTGTITTPAGIVNLNNIKASVKVVVAPEGVTTVILTSDSMTGLTPGYNKITGLTSGKAYKVTVDPAGTPTVKYTKADGTLTTEIGDKVVLNTGVTEITGLAIGTTYKVEEEAAVASEGSWEDEGIPGFSAGGVANYSLYVYNGIPYAAYSDVDNYGNVGKAIVKKFNGSSWEDVGIPGISAGRAYSTSLYVYNGTPYLAYMDYENNHKATVKKFNGSSWEDVGTSGVSTGPADYTSLYVYKGIPYLAYMDNGGNGKATVKKFNGSSWEDVGTPEFSTGFARYLSLYVYDGTPYVAYTDDGIEQRATVKKFNGSSWVDLGTAGVAAFTYLNVYNGTPYITYQDCGNGNKSAVKKFNGSSWEDVGTPAVSTGIAPATSLHVYNGTPYIAYSEFDSYGNVRKGTVKKFNGSSWEGVGTATLTDKANYPYLYVYNGTLYVFYSDAGNSNKATVKKFVSSSKTITTAAVGDINVANGTALGAATLPQTVTITLSDNTTVSAPVTWDNNSTPTYNGSVAGTYSFTGTITTPDGITNPNNVKASVKVVVAPQTVPTTTGITAGKGLVRIITGKPQYANSKIPFVINSQSFSQNPTGYSFDVIYDPTKVGTVTVDSFSSLTKPTVGTPSPAADSSKKKVTVSWNGTLTGDYNSSKGVLFKLNFVAKQDFTSGETPIEIGTGGSFTFASGTSSVTGTTGKITSGIIYGDVNGDGAITSSDTNLINKYVSGKTSAITDETKKIAADVNGDGSITAADAKEISNYISGKTSTLKTLFGY
jgi:FOG: WD40-like repeat